MTSRRPMWHLGVVYHDHRQLSERLAPIVAQALENQRDVMAWLPLSTAEVLDRTLTDQLGPGAERVTYLDPLILGAEGDTVARQLRALTARDRPALVIAPSTLAHGHRPSLGRLADDPHQLICVCRHDAPTEIVEQFRQHHSRLALTMLPRGSGQAASELPPQREPILTFAVENPRSLRELRFHLSRLLDAAGFDPTPRDRAVLAVHEAAVVACRFTASGAQPTAAPAQVRAHLGPGELVADIESPSRGTLLTWSNDPLRISRAFCDQVSRSGSLRTRRLRVQVLTQG